MCPTRRTTRATIPAQGHAVVGMTPGLVERVEGESMVRDRDASVRHSGLGFGDASDMEVQGNGMQKEQKAERCLLERLL